MSVAIVLNVTSYSYIVQCITFSFAGLGWPVNYHFVFYICVLVIFLVVVLTFFLPKTIETKRDTLEKSIASD